MSRLSSQHRVEDAAPGCDGRRRVVRERKRKGRHKFRPITAFPDRCLTCGGRWEEDHEPTHVDTRTSRDRKRLSGLDLLAARPVCIDGEGVDGPCDNCGHDKALCPARGYSAECDYPDDGGGDVRCLHCKRVGGRMRSCPSKAGTICRFPHYYVLLVAADEHGELDHVADPGGLNSYQCLRFLTGLRHRDGTKVTMAAGYGLGYDFALWVKDVPSLQKYALPRPEIRMPCAECGHALYEHPEEQVCRCGHLQHDGACERAGCECSSYQKAVRPGACAHKDRNGEGSCSCPLFDAKPCKCEHPIGEHPDEGRCVAEGCDCATFDEAPRRSGSSTLAEYWSNFKLNLGPKYNPIDIDRMHPWDEATGRRPKGSQGKIRIWDLLRTFNMPYVTVAEMMGAISKDEADVMQSMKDDRAHFGSRRTPGEVLAYCISECVSQARLVKKFHETCVASDVKLRRWDSSGSISSALLEKMVPREISDDGKKRRRCMGPTMRELAREHPGIDIAIASAFFGGRFDCAGIGPIIARVLGRDLASSYPANFVTLPCLTHGRWVHVSGKGLEARIRTATLALVHCAVYPSEASEAWAPLPWRDKGGSIVFPRAVSGTWCWHPEYLEARKRYDIKASEAWIYTAEGCSCGAPFGDLVRIYLDRVRLDEECEGRGIIYKNGPNGVYGKTCQTVGASPFQSWIYAGVCTSITRARLLEAIGCARDPWSVLQVATDGLWTTEDLDLPDHSEPSTRHLLQKPDGKPLGYWTTEDLPEGIMLVRPGVYGPRYPEGSIASASREKLKKMIKKVRARGVGKKQLLEHLPRVEEYWHKHQRCCLRPGRLWLPWSEDKPTCDPYRVTVTRFVGLKSGVVSRDGTPEGAEHWRDSDDRKLDHYGRWEPIEIDVSFRPTPKRLRIIDGQRLEPFTYYPEPDVDPRHWKKPFPESAPYRKTVLSPEAVELRRVDEIMTESGLEVGSESEDA